jgi:hypothetical protein
MHVIACGESTIDCKWTWTSCHDATDGEQVAQSLHTPKLCSGRHSGAPDMLPELLQGQIQEKPRRMEGISS